MRITDYWLDYEILDTSLGEKLERWGDIILIRPDPQIIWNTPKKHECWENYHARYLRASSGGGRWEIKKRFSDKWNVIYRNFTFVVSPTGFKHTGLFPEQATNWDFIMNKISSENRLVNVLNLFAYTGGATLASAVAGANVCHVDASKGMVLWAKENALKSDLNDKPIRWIVDDCVKFVNREYRRGKKYDAIILDPPSYGRGPNGEIWKLEENIYELLKICAKLLSEQPLFFILNSYSSGLSSGVMQYLIETVLREETNFKYDILSDEIGLRVKSNGLILPCGNTIIVSFNI